MIWVVWVVEEFGKFGGVWRGLGFGVDLGGGSGIRA